MQQRYRLYFSSHIFLQFIFLHFVPDHNSVVADMKSSDFLLSRCGKTPGYVSDSGVTSRVEQGKPKNLP